MRKLLQGKFLIALVALLALLVLAAACGDDEEEGPTATPTPAAATPTPAAATPTPAAATPTPAAATPAPPAEPVPGVTATSIRVGVPAFYTGPVGQHGASYAAGWDACFKYINAQGGINGRTIDFITDDTAYDPTRATGIATKLVTEDEVFAIVASQDATFHAAAGQYLADQGVPNIGPDGLDPGQFLLPQTFPVGDPAVIGGHILTDFAIKELGATKIATGALPITTLGDRFTDGVNEVAQQLGAEIVLEQEVPFGFAEQAAWLASARDRGADTIIGLWDIANMVGFLEAARSIGWTPPNGWLMYSGEHDALGTWTEYTDVLPNGLYIQTHFDTTFLAPKSDEIKLFEQAIADYGDPSLMQLFYEKPDGTFDGPSYAVAAWVACRMFQHVAEQLGDNLTREALVEAVLNLENYDTGFGPVFDYPSTPDKVVNRGSGILWMRPDGTYEQALPWTEDPYFTEP